jgi:hypothetical protein
MPVIVRLKQDCRFKASLGYTEFQTNLGLIV